MKREIRDIEDGTQEMEKAAAEECWWLQWSLRCYKRNADAKHEDKAFNHHDIQRRVCSEPSKMMISISF